ncbi:uncharacterized protein LOC118397379 isoform X2 [Oncorhynchus keta]|uniref:uncharacterized protein LOC118397379 isoform X2 n=1 Tax=Oncorhynchus keta TaxID=8018 RepID=UPI0015FCB766|nr:uncharacterized protein LOC118397379 isoform X2 [Oncorhynchus keta]
MCVPYHFVDKRPTEEHPFTEKWLGYDAPVQIRRRHLIRTLTHTYEDNCDVESDLSVPMALQHKDADTQWDVPALTDHSYVSREPVNKPICHKQTQCGGAESLTHTILKNDTSSVLYTGLPLSVFFNHVAFLHKFYTANFKMHITDQILITLMKLNLLHSDIAEYFAVSQGVVSRILSYWIDTMEELMRIYIPWQPRGRCSDKFITQNSGFLEYLRPGNEVMADGLHHPRSAV